MPWVSFQDKAEFVAYHDQACADHGIPEPGKRQSDGVTMLGNQWTTAWVRPVEVGGALKAFVPDEDVTTYTLTPTDPPPDDQAGDRKVSWDAEVDKPLPDTWDGKPVPKTSTSTTTTKTAATGTK